MLQLTFMYNRLLPKSPNGRDQSTVSWEYDFKVSAEGPVFFKFDQLKPTYRGREKEDAEPLDLKNIKRISLMMRSYVHNSVVPISNFNSVSLPHVWSCAFEQL